MRLILAALPMVVLWFALAGAANAALPTGDSINQVSKPSTTWQGQLYAIGEVSDPTLCPPQALDPGNVICDHFQLNTQTTGPVRVLITWPNLTPDTMGNDFDLLVCLNTTVDTTMDDCTGGDLVAEDLGNGPFALAQFNAIAGQTYEVRVIPFFVIASDYKGCATYTTAASNCPVPAAGQQAAAASATCPAGNTLADRRITGGGDIANSAGDMKEHFSLNVARKTNGSSSPLQGKVSYKNDDTLQFKSTSLSCVAFYDEGTDANGHPNGSAEVRGMGRLRQNGSSTDTDTCFRAFARDTGEPGGSKDGGSDQFDIEFVPTSTDANGNITCTFQGVPVGRTITQGNIDYHLNS